MLGFLFFSSISTSPPCQRPYHVEHTSSRPITEVKQHWARIVLGWETAWELRGGYVRVGGSHMASSGSLPAFRAPQCKGAFVKACPPWAPVLESPLTQKGRHFQKPSTKRASFSESPSTQKGKHFYKPSTKGATLLASPRPKGHPFPKALRHTNGQAFSQALYQGASFSESPRPKGRAPSQAPDTKKGILF